MRLGNVRLINVKFGDPSRILPKYNSDKPQNMVEIGDPNMMP